MSKGHIFRRRKRKEILKPTEEILIPVNDTIRFRIHLYKKHGKGELFNYVYQLEAFHKGKWKPIIRYNNFHGFIHKDTFDVEGNRVKRELFGKMTIQEATKIADRDIRINYEKYIREFIESEEK